MEHREKYINYFGAKMEQQIFVFCFKFCINNNFPLDWLHPCGFKQYYILQCERFKTNIELNPPLREVENITELSDRQMKLGYVEKKATFIEKIYSSDHACAKCGAKKISITKMQLRAADEGPTTIFTCDQCGHKRKEN